MAPPYLCQQKPSWELRLSSLLGSNKPLSSKVVSVKTTWPRIWHPLGGKENSDHSSFPQWRGVRADTGECYDFHPGIMTHFPPPTLCQWRPLEAVRRHSNPSQSGRYQWRPGGKPELLLTPSRNKEYCSPWVSKKGEWGTWISIETWL